MMCLEQEGRDGLAVVLDDGTRHVVTGAVVRAYEEPGFDYEGTRATWSEAALFREPGGPVIVRVTHVVDHEGGTDRHSYVQDFTSADGGRTWTRSPATSTTRLAKPHAELSTHRDVMPLLLDRYRVTRTFAAGSSGPLFEVVDESLARAAHPSTALIAKRLDVVANDARARARFEEQREKVIALRHPNVLAMHAWAIAAGGTPIVVTERATKRSLAEGSLRDGIAFQPDRTCRIGDQLLAALDAAHAIGLVHGDVRPANVFLDRDVVTDAPIVKVGDFGLAYVLEDPVSTRTGAVATGRLPYVAPERLRGAPPDVRSDVYSAGLVLWEMLAGRRAFTAPPVIALVSEIMTSSPPPLGPLAKNASAELVAVVERAIAKNPAHRWPTAASMREALVTFVGAGLPART